MNAEVITPEQLLTEGLRHLREAHWEAAADIFQHLVDQHPGVPEYEQLLAHAQLKVQINRAAIPDAAPPPRKTQITPLTIGLGAFVFAAIFGIGVSLMQPKKQTPIALAPVAQVEEPAPAAPAPVQSRQVEAERPDALLVRMAEGQQVQAIVPNIVIILDASGSMLGRIDDVRKINIAHDALDTLITGMPEGANVSLRSYGHRRTDDCSDLELIAPLSPLDRDDLITKVRGVNPINLSRTPIAESLRATSTELNGVQGDTLVILVSDGDETCDGDPVQAAAELRAAHPNVRVSVVGFDVGPEEWRNRLQGIADQGGGEYFNAENADQLTAALKDAIQLTYSVYDMRGREVFTGPVGSPVRPLPDGIYTVTIEGAATLKLPRLRIGGTQTTIELRQENAQLTAKILRR
ncbi:MAG: hypothetical protein Fur005_21660 [Roseiflexaceae bacterium]